MFQITLTGKVVTFREYLMIASEPCSYGGETKEPKSWKMELRSGVDGEICSRRDETMLHKKMRIMTK